MTCAIAIRDLRKTYVVHDDGAPMTLMEALSGKAPARRVKHVINAVDGISLDIAEGERVGIIGPNGAGKSTLLQLITGITTPTSGTIEILGRVNAVLTLGAGLREDVTGRENFYLDAAVQGIAREQVEAEIEDAIAFADLGDFIDRPVRTYSTGMKARLAFSTISFMKPAILIIDEVLAVGDPSFSRKAAEKMRALTASGRIVLLVSHAMTSVTELCTRCLWIENGRVVMDGPAEAVVKAYEARQTEADEAAMVKRFEAALKLPPAADGSAIEALALKTAGSGRKRTVLEARAPAVIEVDGRFGEGLAAPDLRLEISRVDGERLWASGLRGAGLPPKAGPFTATVDLDPFMLGVHLYRLDAVITDGDRKIAGASTAFEVIDRRPQIGGRPMLFHPPRIGVGPAL
jgi:lipopolysaccharide transport system ATP-binding protein